MPAPHHSRRQFMALAGTAAIAAGACTTLPSAQPYDLVIKGGRVIDPVVDLDFLLDVAIADGRIAHLAPDIPVGPARVLDASGKLVVPGLIDIHTHAAVDPRCPPLILADGVTSWIEGGWYGADDIAAPVAAVKAAPQTAGILVNIGRTGFVMRAAGKVDLTLADVAAATRAIAENRAQVIGVKTHLSRSINGEEDREILRRAQEVTRPFGLPVMVHIGDTASPLPALLELMKPGDIVTHTYTDRADGIIGPQGAVLPEVLAARRRGVLFDWGHGTRGHSSWQIAERAIGQGFVADTISSDGTIAGYESGSAMLTTIMTNVLSLGVPLTQVIAMTTINAARAFPLFAGRGTLAPGAPADVALLELRQGTFEVVDTSAVKRQTGQKFFASGTVLGGEVITQGG